MNFRTAESSCLGYLPGVQWGYSRETPFTETTFRLPGRKRESPFAAPTARLLYNGR